MPKVEALEGFVASKFQVLPREMVANHQTYITPQKSKYSKLEYAWWYLVPVNVSVPVPASIPAN
jgi:hypothetical protein